MSILPGLFICDTHARMIPVRERDRLREVEARFSRATSGTVRAAWEALKTARAEAIDAVCSVCVAAQAKGT